MFIANRMMLASQPSLPVLIDSYALANADTWLGQLSGVREDLGFAITLAADTQITSFKLLGRKVNSPTGNVTGKIYASSGTVGSTAIPTGSVLATSAVVDVATYNDYLTGDGYAWVEFVFASPYSALAGDFCLLATYTGGDGSNQPQYGADNSSPSSGINYFSSNTTGSAWATDTPDPCFELYGRLL